MDKFQIKEQLIDHYDVNTLSEIVDKLKFFNYKKIQYIPTNFSLLSIVKEHENIANLFIQKKHLLFYYSSRLSIPELIFYFKIYTIFFFLPFHFFC